MKKKSTIASILVVLALALAVALRQFLPAEMMPAQASSPQAEATPSIQGIPVLATSSAVVDFAELARLEALHPATAGPAIGLEIPFNYQVEPPDVRSVQGASIPTAESVKPLVASSAPSLSYQGLDDIAGEGGSYYIPPDTMGAVGISRIIDTLNNNYRVQTKSTGATVNTVSIASFWAGTGAYRPFDPVTLYDPYNNRFIVIAVSNSYSTTSSIEVGVSTGSDPNGTYNLFRYQICSAVSCGSGGTDWWADYPAVGFNKNWVAISVNMFGTSDSVFKESRVLIVNYPSLIAGTFSASLVTAVTDFTVRPCVTYSSSEETLYAPTHYSSAGASYRLNKITGTASSPTFTQGSLKTHTLAPMSGGWSAPGGNILPQAAGSSGAGDVLKIDSGDARIINCTVRDGNIWYAQTVYLPAGAATHTAAQWVRLDASGNDVDGGRVEDPTATATNGGKWYAYPSITVNKFNDVLMGFSQFSSSQWPSAGYAYRLGGDATGTMRDPYIYKPGEGMYWKTYGGSRNRWGDYSATMVDPEDDTAMWTLQEYAKPEGWSYASTGANSGVWSTYWARVSDLTTATPTPTTVSGTATPTVTATPTSTATRTATATSSAMPTTSVTATPASTSQIFLPVVLKAPPTPASTPTSIPTATPASISPGFWKNSSGSAEFYVSPD
ncbi:MAG: hypothetical protein Q7O66_12120, partial [Dehalococcoidia bacterium]|nr:hypothetical protein [Dehalococcoidia bacterium]